jgi:hypothetical protein
LALLVLLLVGIVLLPLRAVAATAPMLFAYDVAVRPTATTVVGGYEAARSEAERPAFNDYDSAHVGYDDHSNPHVAAGAGAVHAYDDLADRREASEGAIYDAPFATPAAEAAGPVVKATELTGITANKVMGDAAADELAESLRQAGLTVEREVPYSTPVGTRVADLRVSGPDGTVRGLVEVKVGASPYTVLQRLKDFFVKSIYGHPTNVVRYPTYP